jgi:two-component system, chemotaxis family, response regulator WspF
MRIAVVNDMQMSVEVLKRVATSGGHEIAWVARNGAEAVEKCARDRPDLILMDLIMPVMDGVAATGIIMRDSPCAVLLVTATVGGNVGKIFEAMGCGALDVVRTPVLGAAGLDGAEGLLGRIDRIGTLIGKETSAPVSAGPAPARASEWPPLVAIGSSTGGPKALATLLSTLPLSLEAPVLIAQHVDRQFAAGLADWLNEQTELQVVVAGEGERPRPGTVYLAGTSDHLVLGADLALHYTRDPAEYPYRPSADVLFLSLKQHWPQRGVGIVLTGMGRDGASGLLALRQAGWHTIAQDQRTSVVYGMPRAARDLGAAAEILPIESIAGAAAVRLHDLEKRR